MVLYTLVIETLLGKRQAADPIDPNDVAVEALEHMLETIGDVELEKHILCICVSVCYHASVWSLCVLHTLREHRLKFVVHISLPF